MTDVAPRKSELVARAYAALLDAKVIRHNSLFPPWLRTPDAPEAEELARVVVNALWDAGAFHQEAT